MMGNEWSVAVVATKNDAAMQFFFLLCPPPRPFLFSPLFFPSPCVSTAPWLEYAYVYSPWRGWLTWFFLGFSARGGGQLDLQPEGLSLRWREGFRLGQAHFES